MDRGLIEEKLESLRRCVQRVASKRPDTVAELRDNWDLQDIIALNLTRAVQLSVDIAAHIIAESNQPSPDTMAEAFDRLRAMGVISEDLNQRLKGAVGFRNIAIHQYRSIDWQVVLGITRDHLDDFRQLASCVVSYLDR
jgi:uncharacterized protein YutE (UPF0331/DUF86 family)